MSQLLKNLPAMQETRETWVQSLDQEDPLKKEIATHSSSLAWKIPRMEKPGRPRITKRQTRLSDQALIHTGNVSTTDSFLTHRYLSKDANVVG